MRKSIVLLIWAYLFAFTTYAQAQRTCDCAAYDKIIADQKKDMEDLKKDKTTCNTNLQLCIKNCKDIPPPPPGNYNDLQNVIDGLRNSKERLLAENIKLHTDSIAGSVKQKQLDSLLKAQKDSTIKAQITLEKFKQTTQSEIQALEVTVSERNKTITEKIAEIAEKTIDSIRLAAIWHTQQDSTRELLSERLDRIIRGKKVDTLYFFDEKIMFNNDNAATLIRTVPIPTGKLDLDFNIQLKNEPKWAAKLKRIKRLMYDKQDKYKISLMVKASGDNDMKVSEQQIAGIKKYLMNTDNAPFILNANNFDDDIIVNCEPNCFVGKSPINTVMIVIKRK